MPKIIYELGLLLFPFKEENIKVDKSLSHKSSK